MQKGVARKEGVTFFRGGCSFYIENKLKSEIFDDKKICQQKCFFYDNSEFKVGNLTKNLVIFKRWDWFKDEKF